MRSEPRHITRLDPALPLSAAIATVLCRTPSDASATNQANGHQARSRFALGRTMLVVPGGRLARAIERRLIELARESREVLEAPTIVTPLMLFGRFIVPSRPMLSRIGAQASWREALERIASNDVPLLERLAAAFGSPSDMPERLRPRIASRLTKLSVEVASAMHTFGSVRSALAARASAGESTDSRLLEHWTALEKCARVRDALLDEAQVADRDNAFRDALAREFQSQEFGSREFESREFQSQESESQESQSQQLGEVSAGAAVSGSAKVSSILGFDRVVILFADPEPVHLALFRVLEARGVSIEICVHRVNADDASECDRVSDGVLTKEGFPVRARWAAHAFGSQVIRNDAIRVGEGPSDAATEVVASIRAIPTPRRSNEIAVMAPDDETRRAIERALGEVGTRAARTESRVFAATRLGMLLARLEDLLGDESMESFAAYIRHPDVARASGCVGAERDTANYRVATVAEYWRDRVVDAHGSQGFKAIRDAVVAQVAPLAGARSISAWARPLRAFLASVVGEDASGAFEEERAQSIAALDRVLGDLADVPATFSTAISCSDVIRIIRAAVDRTEIRGVGRTEGVSLIQWLDAGLADEPHLVLAGFADGVVPEGDVADTLLPDAVRRDLGFLSSLRRAARDAWILDGILLRARARQAAGLPASVQFVVARRSATGDPLRPSRYLLRVEPSALPARVARLFPAERERDPVVTKTGATVEFPVRPKVEGSVFRTISVTAFRTYLKCPYLFQLQNDPRLRLSSLDESAAELDARNFGKVLHDAVEEWGREEIARSQPTTDRAAIEKSVLAHFDAAILRKLPTRPSAAVRVQLEVLRTRLQRFAALQAKEAEAGWHVRFVELKFDEQSGPLVIAASAGSADPLRGLRLVGRIDRVDVHRETGAWRALDYKTGSAGSTPTSTHLKGRKIGSRRWIDLQLPLYRHLLAEAKQAIHVASSGLGYINLAASAEKSGVRMLECSPEEFDDAFGEAQRVVQGVLDGEFTPAARTPFPPDDPLAAVWGLGLRSQVLGQSDPLGGEADRDGAGDGSASGGDA